MLATFLGCFVLFTFPDWVAAQLNRSLPYWFYEREVSCNVCISCNIAGMLQCVSYIHDIVRLTLSIAFCCVQQAILAVGTALANWIMSSFYR